MGGKGERRKGGGGNRPRGALGFTANWDVATLLPPGQQRQRMGKLEGHGLNSIKEGEEGGGERRESGEIRGKWGGGASSVDTPVEDERQPLFKTSWSRSPVDTVALHWTFGSL